MSKRNAFLEWISVMNNSENNSQSLESPIRLLARLCLRLYNFCEYVHDDSHAWKIILNTISDLIFPEVAIDLPESHTAINEADIAYVSAFIVYLSNFHISTSQTSPQILASMPDKERLLICSVMFDISAYVGGALSINEFKANFMAEEQKHQNFYMGIDPKNSIQCEVQQIQNAISSYIGSQKQYFPTTCNDYANQNRSDNIEYVSNYMYPYTFCDKNNIQNRDYNDNEETLQNDINVEKDGVYEDLFDERLKLKIQLEYAHKELVLLEESYQKQIRYIYKMMERERASAEKRLTEEKSKFFDKTKKHEYDSEIFCNELQNNLNLVNNKLNSLLEIIQTNTLERASYLSLSDICDYIHSYHYALHQKIINEENVHIEQNNNDKIDDNSNTSKMNVECIHTNCGNKNFHNKIIKIEDSEIKKLSGSYDYTAFYSYLKNQMKCLIKDIDKHIVQTVKQPKDEKYIDTSDTVEKKLTNIMTEEFSSKLLTFKITNLEKNINKSEKVRKVLRCALELAIKRIESERLKREKYERLYVSSRQTIECIKNTLLLKNEQNNNSFPSISESYNEFSSPVKFNQCFKKLSLINDEIEIKEDLTELPEITIEEHNDIKNSEIIDKISLKDIICDEFKFPEISQDLSKLKELMKNDIVNCSEKNVLSTPLKQNSEKNIHCNITPRTAFVNKINSLNN